MSARLRFEWRVAGCAGRGAWITAYTGKAITQDDICVFDMLVRRAAVSTPLRVVGKLWEAAVDGKHLGFFSTDDAAIAEAEAFAKLLAEPLLAEREAPSEAR